MTDKVKENGTVPPQVTTEVTNTPPPTDQQAARKQTVKPRTGAPAGNSNAVTHGARRERTNRGGPVRRDTYDSQGQRYALALFKDRGSDLADPLRQATWPTWKAVCAAPRARWTEGVGTRHAVELIAG